MATVEEKWQGVRGDYNSRSVDFVVRAADDAGDAITATLVYMAASGDYPGNLLDGLPLNNVSVEELSEPIGLYVTTASFSKVEPEEPDTNDIETSFDITLESRRVYSSLSTVSYYPATGENHKPQHNRINVLPDGTVEGADVRTPVASWQITWFAPQASVTSAYRRTVLETVGKVNDATFYGHAAGEVLFTGASGSVRSGQDWQITFRFEVNKNRTGVSVGEGADAITGIAVEGWELLWVDFREEADTDGGGDPIAVFKPREAYVEQMYDSADFSVLGVGTS